MLNEVKKSASGFGFSSGSNGPMDTNSIKLLEFVEEGLQSQETVLNFLGIFQVLFAAIFKLFGKNYSTNRIMAETIYLSNHNSNLFSHSLKQPVQYT